MAKLTRRDFVGILGTAGTGAGLLGWPWLAGAGQAKGRVVIVGGGFGGASCAKYLRRFAPDVEITLVERDAKFVTCPFSNAVMAGLYDLEGFLAQHIATDRFAKRASEAMGAPNTDDRPIAEFGFARAVGTQRTGTAEVLSTAEAMDAESADAALEATEAMCRKLLANPVTEDFEVSMVGELEGAGS